MIHCKVVKSLVSQYFEKPGYLLLLSYQKFKMKKMWKNALWKTLVKDFS